MDHTSSANPIWAKLPSLRVMLCLGLLFGSAYFSIKVPVFRLHPLSSSQHSTTLPPAQFTNVDTSTWVGAQYVPAEATNELWWYYYEMHEPAITRELSAAKRRLGYTAVRVFLHSLLYADNSSLLLTRMDKFLTVAGRIGIRTGFVFFDDCWSPSGADLRHPCVARKGVHNGCWMQSPQSAERTDAERFEPYVKGVVSRFATDARVLFWEIYNEPAPQSSQLRALAYNWIAEVGPSQPVISCWDDNPSTDIVDVHRYDGNFQNWAQGIYLNPAKGAVVTEAGARWYQGRSDLGSPLRVVEFLQQQRRDPFVSYVPGVFINWEVMIGNSNTRWAWGSPEGTREPSTPFHGLLFPDGTPFSFTEAAAIRNYSTGVDDFLYLNTFPDAHGLHVTQDTVLFLAAPAQYPLPIAVSVAVVELSFMALGGDFGFTLLARCGPGGAYAVQVTRRGPAATITLLRVQPFGCGQAGAAVVLPEAVVNGTHRRGAQGRRAWAPHVEQYRQVASGTVQGSVHRAQRLRGQVLGTLDISELDCGMPSDGWSILRLSLGTGSIKVWFNTMWLDTVAPDGSVHPPAPRIVADTAGGGGDLVEGSIVLASTVGGVNIDYVSVLKPSVLE